MKKNIAVLSLGVISLLSASAYAADVSNKGLQFGSKTDPHWFTANGILSLDQRLFTGTKNNKLTSGAYIKKFDIDLAGGLGKDLSFTAGVGFNAATSKVEVNDAYLTYAGYKGLGDNFSVSIGKVNPNFCLENSSSSKWIPFLEKSIAVTAFAPDPGLGISLSKWQKDYSLGVSITQPKPNETATDVNGVSDPQSDRLQLNARATKAHFFGDNKFLQLGFSGNIKDSGHRGLEFSTGPEAKSRNSTTTLLNTTVTGKEQIKARNHYVVGLELMGQNGPLSGQAEGLLAKVRRDKTQFNRYNPTEAAKNITFKSYYATVNYVLTGESRDFKSDQGTLGRVVPNKECGALEVSGRYSFLNLNDKDIKGGADHSLGLALTWYANYNITVTGEVVNHHLKKSNTLQKLNFNSIGARLQLVF